MAGRTIVAAIDGSEQADYALDWTINNIYKKNDKILMVHCPEYIVSKGLLENPIEYSEYFAKAENDIQILIAKYAEKLKKAQIQGSVIRLVGKPGEAIIETATKENASMIITGTRGLGKLSRTLLGSVSDYVVHNATIPVVVVRPLNS